MFAKLFHRWIGLKTSLYLTLEVTIFALFAYIDYERSKVFVRDVLTHAEYDKDNWKNDDWYR